MKTPWLILGILLLIVTGCNPERGAITSTEEDGFSFAFLTDIHLQTEKNAVEGFRQAIDTINKLHPDFVITGGDLVMDVLDQTYGRADSLYTLYREISIDQEQMYWLKKDLEKTDRQTPIAISVNIPFITSRTQLNQGALAANSEGGIITNSREVLQLFADHKLKLVLQGHLHYNEDLFVGNRVHFITAGAVSGRC